jgi:hypothetical protein
MLRVTGQGDWDGVTVIPSRRAPMAADQLDHAGQVAGTATQPLPGCGREAFDAPQTRPATYRGAENAGRAGPAAVDREPRPGEATGGAIAWFRATGVRKPRRCRRAIARERAFRPPPKRKLRRSPVCWGCIAGSGLDMDILDTKRGCVHVQMSKGPQCCQVRTPPWSVAVAQTYRQKLLQTIIASTAAPPETTLSSSSVSSLARVVLVSRTSILRMSDPLWFGMIAARETAQGR